MHALMQGGLNGPEPGFDSRRIARAITAVENHSEGADSIIRDAYRAARYVPVVGITGPSGAGKSTLVDRLAVRWAEDGEKIAVLAVDPSSAFTGGALLGDRIRMDRAASHPNVFMRSLASRGELGGLTNTTTDIVMMLGALGFDRVLLETVGAGQTDISIGRVADVVMVMAVPGSGDHIQAAKAGILEIADVYVVNKCDLPGAASVAAHLESNLDLVYSGAGGRNVSAVAAMSIQGNRELHRRHVDVAGASGYWRPPVMSLSAHEDIGIDRLAAAVDDFLAWSRETGRDCDRVKERLRFQILNATQSRLLKFCLAAAARRDIDLDRLVTAVASGAASPDEAAERLLEQVSAKDAVDPARL